MTGSPVSKQEFIENTSKNYLVNILSFFFGFFYLFVIAKTLGPEKFGQVTFAITIVPGFAILFGLSAMQDIIVNFGAKYKNRSLLGKIFLASIFVSVVLSLGIVLLGKFFTSVFGVVSYPLLLASVPILGLFVIYSFYYSLFQAFKRFGFLVKITLVDSVANLGFALVLFFVFRMDVYAIVLARILAFVVDIVYFWSESRSLKYSKESEWQKNEVIEYSLKAFAIELPKQFPGQAINWLLGIYAPVKALGEYFFAQKIVAGAIDNIYTAIKETVYPYSNENFNDRKIVMSIISKSVKMAFLVNFIAFATLSILIYPFLKIFFPVYIDAWPIAILLGLGSLINTTLISLSFLRTFRYLNDTFRLTLEYGLVLVGLSVALIPEFGVYGLATAKILSAIWNHVICKRGLEKRGFVFSVVPGQVEFRQLSKAAFDLPGNVSRRLAGNRDEK